MPETTWIRWSVAAMLATTTACSEDVNAPDDEHDSHESQGSDSDADHGETDEAPPTAAITSGGGTTMRAKARSAWVGLGRDTREIQGRCRGDSGEICSRRRAPPGQG